MEDNVVGNLTSGRKAEDSTGIKSKELKSGIIYLSRIPTGMNPNIIRQYFNRFGETGRMYLQQQQHGNAANRNKKRRLFSEGWVEFHKKKIAKLVARSLNNEPIGGKKKNPWREELWNIKYLPKFKWSHLHERLVYERAVHSQRLRAEITQAKREANFYIENAEKNVKLKRKEKKKLKEQGKEDTSGSVVSDKQEKVFEFRQKETEEEILSGKTRKRRPDKDDETENSSQRKKHRKTAKDSDSGGSGSRKSFLTKIFSGGVESESE